MLGGRGSAHSVLIDHLYALEFLGGCHVSADTNTGDYVVFWTVLRAMENVWGFGPVLVRCVVDWKN